MYTCIINTSSKWLLIWIKNESFWALFHLCQYINDSPITNANRENFFEWYLDYLLLLKKISVGGRTEQAEVLTSVEI